MVGLSSVIDWNALSARKRAYRARAVALGIGAVDLCDEAGPRGGGAPTLDGLDALGVIAGA